MRILLIVLLSILFPSVVFSEDSHESSWSDFNTSKVKEERADLLGDVENYIKEAEKSSDVLINRAKGELSDYYFKLQMKFNALEKEWISEPSSDAKRAISEKDEKLRRSVRDCINQLKSSDSFERALDSCFE